MEEQKCINQTANLEEDWSKYPKLDFDPCTLSQKTKTWLRQYLVKKYPGAEEDYRFEVVKWLSSATQPMSGWSDDNLWEYLWCLLIVYKAVPTVSRVNELYDKLGTPAYTQIWPQIGKDMVWSDTLLKMAYERRSEEGWLKRVFGEKTVENFLQSQQSLDETVQPAGTVSIETAPEAEVSNGESLASCREAIQSDLEVQRMPKHFELGGSNNVPLQSVSEPCEDTTSNNSPVQSTSLEEQLIALGVRNEAEPPAETEDLYQRLMDCLPEWPDDLIEWLFVQVEFLRKNGLTPLRERNLMALITASDKTDWHYVLLAALECPSMQSCLLRSPTQRFAELGIKQLMFDLLVIYDNNVPRAWELEQVMGLGLPSVKEVEEVFGCYQRGWRRKIASTAKSGEVRECVLSPAAKRVADHAFSVDYRLRRGVIQKYRVEDGKLVLFVSFDSGKHERIILEKP